jgi:small subunit ribosomal protein S4
MARYIGPKSRIARRFRDPIFGADKSYEKKNYPPGMHGQTKRRAKVSEYGTQLMEKQKAKYTYGILERQFRNIFLKAARKGGITGEVLLQLIESRLDNVVYRMGISPTRDGARQLIGHRHILVNGKVANIPSMELKPGDIVGVRERSKSLEIITDSLSGRGNQYPWLEWDGGMMAGKFMSYPERDQIPENIREQLIVELYSK